MLGAIAILLLLSFGLIYTCASYSLKLVRKFPDVSCENLPDYDSHADMTKAAVREWSINHALQRQGIEVSYNGYVQCFCNERAVQGDPTDAHYGNDGEAIC